MRLATLCLGGLALFPAHLTAQNAARTGAAAGPFVRIEAGALNPDDPVRVTMAFGGMFGWRFGRSAIGVQALVQSQNRNSGTDLLADARTLIMLTYEQAGRPRGPRQRQGFLRLGTGVMLRNPFTGALVVDGGIGLRYRMTRALVLVGTLQDAVAFLARDTYYYCPSGGLPGTPCGTFAIKPGPQHNFGLTIAFEYMRLRI